jgi:RNA polymerase sigma-70 factor (ECF subfamily)
MTYHSAEITRLLQRWRKGDRTAADSLVAATYEEMRRVARAYLRRERRDHTLQPTALVHEAYLRLFHDEPVDLDSREAFFRLMASQMRRHLIDHARRHGAEKRGAGLKVNLDDFALRLPAPDNSLSDNDLQLLDAALGQLAADHPRVAEIVQHRYFADESLEEVAASVGVSLATVKRELAFARVWLLRELRDH